MNFLQEHSKRWNQRKMWSRRALSFRAIVISFVKYWRWGLNTYRLSARKLDLLLNLMLPITRIITVQQFLGHRGFDEKYTTASNNRKNTADKCSG
jgi:hypothetical protein